MSLQSYYLASIFALPLAIVVIVVLCVQRKESWSFTLQELATLALLICMAYVAVLPWKIGLSHVPGLDALIYSVPYTVILLMGIRMIPKPGTVTMLIVGEGIFGQLVGTGVNPSWWPYYLWSAVVVELLLLTTNDYARTLAVCLAVGILRAILVYTYMYLLLAPLLWHLHYADWYIIFKIAFGVLGSTIGALFAWRLAPGIERAIRHVG